MKRKILKEQAHSYLSPSGVKMSVGFDSQYENWTIYFPQIEIGSEKASETGIYDQIIFLGDSEEVAKIVFEKAKEIIETNDSVDNVYNIFKDIEKLVDNINYAHDVKPNHVSHEIDAGTVATRQDGTSYLKENVKNKIMKKKLTTSDLKQYVLAEVKKLHRIEVLKEEKSRISKELKMLNENEVPDSSSEIKNTALSIAPKLMNSPIVLNLADKILKDPKAVSDIKKYAQSMSGGISEEIELGNDFIKKSIEKGIMLSKNVQEDNMVKKMINKELHIPLMGLTGLVGGYLADKYFYNPLIKVAEYVTPYFSDNYQKIPSWIHHDATSHLAHNPTNVVIAGAIAGVFVGAVIVKVLEMISKRKDLNQKSKINEDDSSLRAMLHTLVGNEMKSGKRADMHGSHHIEEHKKAEKELENFLSQNPSMLEFVEEVEEHFAKRLYR